MAAYKKTRNYRTKKGGSINKRANGNFKAARSQTDNGNFVVKGTQMLNAKYLQNYIPMPDLAGGLEVPDVGSTYVNFYEVLNNNKNFTLQKQLWDEFRINKIRVRLTVANAELDINTFNSIKTINVVTAWDRTGLSCRQITALDASDLTTALETNIINPSTEKRSKNVQSFFTRLGPIVEEYGSAFKSPLNSFQNFKRTCNLSVRDGAEKNTWISTELIDAPGLTYNATTTQYICDAKNQKSLEDFENDSNPTNPIENPTIKWKPTLLVSVYNSGLVNNQLVKASDTANVIFNMSYEMDITFRGPRTIA